MDKLGKIILLGIAAASAPAFAQMVCATQPVQPVVIRAHGTSELLPDLVVKCTGGTPTPAGQPVPVMRIYLDVDVEAIIDRGVVAVLVDEPPPAAQTPCTLVTQTSCTILGTGNGSGTYSGAAGRPNVFRALGTFTFPDEENYFIPIDPPGAGNTRTFRFTNLRANIFDFGGGGEQIHACVSLVQPCGFGLPPADKVMAVVKEGLQGLDAINLLYTPSRITGFTLRWTEGFANAFKVRSSAGPLDANQNVPGSPPIYETGFRNLAFTGNFAAVGGSTNGTRLLFEADFVPNGVSITVPTSISFGPNGQSVAKLVAHDDTVPASVPVGGGMYQEATSGLFTPDANQNIFIFYEITNSSPDTVETIDIPVTINYGAGAPATLRQLVGAAGLAPLQDPNLTFKYLPGFDKDNFNLSRGTIDAPGPLDITTASPLPSGFVGTPYSKQIFRTGGNGDPNGGTFVIIGVLPPGLILHEDVIQGTPSVSGTFSFSIQFTDSVGASVVKPFTLTIAPGPQGSTLQLSALQLNFAASQGGAAPLAQSLTIESTLSTTTNFTIATDGGVNLPTPPWLNVSFQSTTAPGRVTVAANQGSLAPGGYSARILVGVQGSNASPLVVTVILTVAAAAPQLSSSADKVEFTSKITTPGVLSQTIQLSNTGGGGAITFAASVVNQSTWIKGITPVQGQTSPASPATVRIDIDTGGLPLGYQRDIIRFTWLGKTLDVPVTVFVAPGGARLQLSRTGVYFRSNAGSLNLQTQQIGILNLDQSSSLLWTATVVQGSEWLAVSSLSGNSTFLNPSSITFGVKADASNLAVGPYYALIRIDAPNTIDAPQYIVGVLDIQPGSTTSGLDFDSAGTVLTALTGSTQTVSHTFQITTGSSASSVAFSASVSSSAAGIFSINPASGSVNFLAGTQLTVSANPTGVAAGVYRAEIPVSTAQGVQTLAVTFIVADAAGGVSIAGGARASSCVRSSLAATQIGVPNNFSVPAGWPTALIVDLRDNCGSRVVDGTVVASFSNGDPPLTLAGDGASALYSATWQPVAQINPMAITISARTSDLAEVTIPLTGGILANTTPVLFRNGTVHNLDPKLAGPLSPGLVAAIFGANLATVSESTTGVPLPPSYKGTQVLIGPYAAPLYYVSPGQLNVQVPAELVPNVPYSVVVSVNGALTVPDTVRISPAVPGIAVYGDGKVIAQHNDFAAHPPYPFVVTAADPAKRDEYLIVYLVGLGLTNPPVATGAPSPGTEPLGRPTVPVTVTLGGQNINPAFVGLTPFAVGLFQITFQVPHDAPLNTPLNLVITQGGLTANISTLTIAP